DTGTVLAEAARILDLSQPVAVLLLGVLSFIPDDEDPAAIVARLMAAVPPGSYLAVAHPASDIAAEQVARSVRRYNLQASDPATVRTYAEVARFFDGLDMVEPGLVQLHRWRAGTDDLELPNYEGVGRKP